MPAATATWRFFFLVILVLVAPVHAARAQIFETAAKQAYMIDAGTGTILFAKDEKAQMPPASLAKLMTAEVVFDALQTGRLQPEDRFIVSENAWRTGGAASKTSTMFAALKSEISVSDLLQGVIVQQANDGSIILAEGMAGSEEAFSRLMNERALQIGLEDAAFVNATGLPAGGQTISVKDIALLSMHLWKSYPDQFSLFAQREFTWNKILQRNRNPLLGMDIGADGLATGFSEEGGFAIAASVNRDGRRIFLAMAGLSGERERAEEARKMLDWGIRAFETIEVFKAGEVIGEADTYGGEKGSVALKADGAVSLLVPVGNRDKVIARIVYEGPVETPVEVGTRVGSLKVWIGDTLSQETPLYTAESVAKGTIPQRALDAIEELALGWLRG